VTITNRATEANNALRQKYRDLIKDMGLTSNDMAFGDEASMVRVENIIYNRVFDRTMGSFFSDRIGSV